MLRFGVRVLSGRVPTRHTAFHNSSLGGRHLCSSTAMDMRGSLGCLLRTLSALVPAWCIRNTSTCAHSSLERGDFLLCWFCFMPTRRMGFVRASFVVLTCPVWSRPLRSLFNLCVDPTSLVGFQQPLPRCRLSATRSLCRLRRQHSLRGRFAPTAFRLSSSLFGKAEPVLGYSNAVIGQSGPVLGYYEKWIRKNIMLNPVFEFRPPT